MNSWFSKTATNVFKPSRAAPPQPFVLSCPECGEPQQGLRQPDFQHTSCRTCHTPRFILPWDVYPAPRSDSPRDEQNAASASTSLDDDISPQMIEIIGDTLEEDPQRDNAPSQPVSSQRASVNGNKELPTLSQLRQRIRNAEKPKRPQLASAVPQKTSPLEGLGSTLGELGRETRQQLVRFWTPFRILTLAVLLVMSVTALWTWRQSALARAVRVAQAEGTLGLEAVDAKEWTRAREHFQLAAEALDRLGRTDPESQTVRQYARETEVLFRMCDLSMSELLQVAQRNRESQNNREAPRDHLAQIYEGDWMLFEGPVREVSERTSRRRDYQMEIPIGPAGQPAETLIRMNFPILNQVIEPGSRKNLIVAGAIENVSFSQSGKWIVTLAPESGFLWTHTNTYEATGLEFNPARPRPAVEAELRQQAQAMGVPE